MKRIFFATCELGVHKTKAIAVKEKKAAAMKESVWRK